MRIDYIFGGAELIKEGDNLSTLLNRIITIICITFPFGRRPICPRGLPAARTRQVVMDELLEK
jgi:hypothetical protein